MDYAVLKGGFPVRGGARIGLVLSLLLFAIAVGVGIDWPAASASMRDLRQAYPDQPLHIRTFKGAGLAMACGFYAVGNKAGQLKYLEDEKALYAERTPGQWQASSQYDPSEGRWEACMNASGRGHTWDFITNPIIVMLLGLR